MGCTGFMNVRDLQIRHSHFWESIRKILWKCDWWTPLYMHLISISCVAVLVIESISHVVFLIASQFWHHLLNKIFWQNTMLFRPTIPSFFQPETWNTHIFFFWPQEKNSVFWADLSDYVIVGSNRPGSQSLHTCHIKLWTEICEIW